MATTRLPLDLDLFRTNLAEIEARALDAVRRREDGGDPQPPKIVIVSKYLEPVDCEVLRGEGIGPLGENRAQDLENKVGPSEDRDGWHFIGHLQRNKIQSVIPRIDTLHSLDSERLAGRIDEWIEQRGNAPLRCLVQVNESGESSKGGLAPFEAQSQIPEWVERFSNLEIVGLMTMAREGEPEEARPVFRALRELKNEIAASLPESRSARFSELSMGMSADFEVAVEEGATLLRIGRILYTQKS